MGNPSIIICGPPYTNKPQILKEVVRSLDLSIDSKLSVSTSRTRLIDDSDMLPLTSESEISPNDLTGIGIEISKWIDEHPTGSLVTFENINTLLMYHDKETTFRFLHVLNGRLDSTDTPFICIQETTDSTPKVQPHLELFDYIVYTRKGESGDIEYNIKQNNEDLEPLRLKNAPTKEP